VSQERIRAALAEASAALGALMDDAPTLAAIEAAAAQIARCLAAGGTAYSCGNGGSLCDAMHFAEELSGRFRDDRPAYAAIAIADPGYLSCVANDYGYAHVFSRFLQAHGRAGDVLLAISTSGASANVVAAAREARQRGVFVIALTGRAASELSGHADLAICTPGGRYADRVQELHIKVIHILIELVEHRLAQLPVAGAAGQAPGMPAPGAA
jgi:D-sedoheptulose 7-phosphate isomerase